MPLPLIPPRRAVSGAHGWGARRRGGPRQLPPVAGERKIVRIPVVIPGWRHAACAVDDTVLSKCFGRPILKGYCGSLGWTRWDVVKFLGGLLAVRVEGGGGPG